MINDTEPVKLKPVENLPQGSLKSTRVLEDIKRDYAKICQEVGDLNYMIKELESAIAVKYEAMFHLKQEHLNLINKTSAENKEIQPDKNADETLPFNVQRAP